MAKKTFILASDELTNEIVSSQQESYLEENFADYVFIGAERDSSPIATEEYNAMIVQEYL